MIVAKLKIAELKKELKERNLQTTGNKSELAARLKEALTAEGTDDAQPEDDLEAKEEELLGEEEDEDTGSVGEDTGSVAELDNKLLDTSAATTPAPKPKKIVINRVAAESAQQAAAAATALAAAAAETPAADAAAAPASKRIRLTMPSELDRLAMRSEKSADGATKPVADPMKILTAEERKAARAAKFAAAADGATVAAAKDGATITAPATNAAAKNGTPAVAADPVAELEKLKKRAGRFGEAVSNKVVSLEAEERLQKRKERFGIVLPEDPKARRAARFGSSTPEDAKSKRAAKFAAVTAPDAAPLDDKKQKRAARFGGT